MRVRNHGTISLYAIDFGETIKQNEVYKMRTAVKNCSSVIEKTIGRFIYHSGIIFAMQGAVG